MRSAFLFVLYLLASPTVAKAEDVGVLFSCSGVCRYGMIPGMSSFQAESGYENSQGKAEVAMTVKCEQYCVSKQKKGCHIAKCACEESHHVLRSGSYQLPPFKIIGRNCTPPPPPGKNINSLFDEESYE